MRLLAAAALWLLCSAFILHPGGGSSGGGGGVAVPLARIFNNPTGSATGSTAFWMIGQPFRSASQAGGTADVPSGDIVSATLGGIGVRVAACNQGGPVLHADNSTRWLRLLIDFSAAPIGSGAAATLQFTATAGSWSSSSNRSASDFENLADTVTLANISGTTAGSISGTYTANFAATGSNGATGTIYQTTTICTTPLGNLYEVKANFYNGTTSFGTTCSCTAVPTAALYYWVTQTSGGSLGPIASWGPFVENLYGLNTGLQKYTADVTWLRNAVQQRQQLALPLYGLTAAVMMRTDGQADWSANDPGIYVTQDYTRVRATQTIPPYVSGISYAPAHGPTPSVTAVSISGGVPTFTVASFTNLFEAEDTGQPAVALQFTGSLGGLSGISLNTLYWACATSSTTFTIYDTYAHAQAGGNNGSGSYSCQTAGQISTASGTYSSGMSAQGVVAPDTNAAWDNSMGDTGSRPDISWASEWGTAYALSATASSTQAWQQLARVQAYALWSAPQWMLSSATGCVPSVLDSGDTPGSGTNCAGGTGLGTTAGATTEIADGSSYSSNINGGSGPAGQSGIIWQLSGAHWFGNVPYIVYLLEGAPYLYDLLMLDGNEGIYNFFAPNRNFQLQGTGTTYYGASLVACNAGNVRRCAWQTRDVGIAAWAAAQGSAEQTYFQNAVTASVNAFTAYMAYESPTWDMVQNDDQAGSSTIGSGPYFSEFMNSFAFLSAEMLSAQDSEFISGLSTVASNLAAYFVALYGQSCIFWADSYGQGVWTKDIGAASPDTQIGSIANVGVQAGTSFSYNAANGRITAAGGYVGGGGSSYTANIAVGDMFRPQNWDNDGNNAAAAPSGLVDGSTYCIATTPSANVFTVYSTPGQCSGAQITSFGSSLSGGGGWLIPAGQSCPSTGFYFSVANQPESYAMYEMAGLGVASAVSIAGALTAYNNGLARAITMPNTLASVAASEAGWAFQSGW